MSAPSRPAPSTPTQGKTGTPKPATLTHHGVLNNASFVGRRFGLDDRLEVGADGGSTLQVHRICCPVPLHGAFGYVLGSLASVLHLGTCVIPCSRFSSAQLLAAMQSQR